MKNCQLQVQLLLLKKVVNNSSEDKTFIIHVVGRDSENAVIYKTDLILKIMKKFF